MTGYTGKGDGGKRYNCWEYGGASMRWDQPVTSGRVFGTRQHWLRTVVSLGFALGLSSPAPEIAQAGIGAWGDVPALTCVDGVRAYIKKANPYVVSDGVANSLASLYLFVVGGEFPT